jgi:RHS repeat-associated protein
MSTTYRVLSDQLYRSVATVTTANVVTEAYDTDAYGNTLCYSGPGTDGEWFTDDDVQTNNPINTTIFTGRQYDPESQIYWYRARYYSPSIGRFISRDSLEDAELSQGPNLYWYVQDNAVNKMDPSGQIPIPILCPPFFVWECENSCLSEGAIGLTLCTIERVCVVGRTIHILILRICECI